MGERYREGKMNEKGQWKRLKLYGQEQEQEKAPDGGIDRKRQEDAEDKGVRAEKEDGERAEGSEGKSVLNSKEPGKSSTYLIARERSQAERQKQLLYDVLGPVFFGKEEARDAAGLADLFRLRYGIDVGKDFYDGDEHYEEYQEARQAIAEGMSIYSGEISFDDSALADLAEYLWEIMEEQDKTCFRRINTMLEE